MVQSEYIQTYVLIEMNAQGGCCSSPLQLRLFCTPISACLASLNSRRPAPVEFPMVCDLRVNNINLSVNLRGKKTPAKVLPPNLNKDGRLNFVGVNTVQMLYAGTSDVSCSADSKCTYEARKRC